ncbi:MAG: CorA family divalent cation transporter, partial [Candidatus Bathyarchaeota archaeon]
MRAILFSPDKMEKIDKVNPSQVSSLLDERCVWLDGTPDLEEEKAIIKKTSLAPSIFKDYRRGVKAKREISTRSAMHIFQELDYDKDLKISPILIIIGDNFIASIHEASSACDEVYHRIDRLLKTHNIYRPNLVCYLIADELNQFSLKAVERAEEGIGHIEEEEAKESHKVGSLRRIASFRRELMKINHANFTFARTLLAFKDEIPADEDKVSLLTDLTYDSLTRQIETINQFREILTESLEIYNAKAVSAVVVASHRSSIEVRDLTLVMLYLTVISTIYLFPNTVATILGIPTMSGGLTTTYVLIIVAVSTAIPTVWILRQRWVKRLRTKGFEIPVIPFLPFLTVGEWTAKKGKR